MFSQQQQIDRLATTSRLLYDVRLISQRQEIEHLKQENEKLKLDIFWRDHSMYRFNEAMKTANIGRGEMECDCALCKLKRDDCDYFNYDDYDIDETACTFLPWLYKMMHEHGFLVGKGLGVRMHCLCPSKFGPPFEYSHGVRVLCHFIHTTMPDMRGRQPEMRGYVSELEPKVIDELKARPQRDFGLFLFGKLLTDAKTVDDPHLKKYAAFIRMLEGVQEEDEDDDDA